MSANQPEVAVADLPGGLATLDVTGVIRVHNRAFASALGLDSHASLIGRRCRDLCHGDYRPAFDAFWAALTASPGETRHSSVCFEHDGSITDVCLSGRQSTDPAEGGEVHLCAEALLQFDIETVNGIFAVGFEQQREAAMIIASGATLFTSRILVANAAAAKRFGRSSGDLPGLNIGQLASEGMSREIRAAAEAAFARGERFNTTYVESLGDGKFGVVDWTLWPLHTRNSQVTHWADRRRPVDDQAEQKGSLHDYHRVLTEALQASEIGIWQWDLVTDRIQFSQRMLASLGYTAEDIEDPHAFNMQLWHPDDRPRMEASIRQAVEARQPFEYVVRLRAADGNPRWFRIRGQAFLDEQGRPTRLVGTESEANDEVVLRERLLFAEQIAKIGYWTSRIDPPLLEWSPGTYRIQGYDPDTYTPKREDILTRLTHPDDRPVVEAAMYRIGVLGEMNRGSHDTFRCRIVRPDGEIRHCEFTAVIDRDASGAIIGSTGTIQDVTELVEMEQQLLRAQKLEVVGQLAGGVAHDFNNLLAVILGNLELLQAVEDPQKRASFLELAMTATQRGGELTRNLLSFARRAVLEPTRLNLNSVIASTGELLDRVLPETVRIDLRFAPDLWTVHADRTSFENALLNLAINARDAMSAGGVLTIETQNRVLETAYPDAARETLAPGRYVVVSVTDTGIGIPESAFADIFIPFYSTKAETQGSGLGLSMVLGFAKQSGGGVRVYSVPGEGATFSLYFPASTASPDASEASREEAPRGPVRGRVLLVEDDADVNRLLAEQVEAIGLSCVAVLNSDEALHRFEDAGPFDLLLTDIGIPGPYNGPALARHLGNRQPGLKVIYISGYPHENGQPAGGPADSHTVLMKPVSRWRLHQALQAVLDAGAVGEGGAAGEGG